MVSRGTHVCKPGDFPREWPGRPQRPRRPGIIAISCLVASIVFAGASGATSEDIDRDYAGGSGDWRFVVSPYAMLANQSTDVGGEKLRQNFSDLSSMTDIGFQLAASIMYERWSLNFDGTYADLGGKTKQSVLELDLDIKQYMADLRLGYMVVNRVDFDDETGVIRGWSLDVNAGAKYWQNDLTLSYRISLGETLAIEDQFGETQHWWDPMAGVKSRIFLNRSVLLGLSASVGGFGVGGASDISTDFVYTNTFKVSRVVSVSAGFRSFRYDRTDGEGDEAVETKVAVLGPLIGLSFVF